MAFSFSKVNTQESAVLLPLLSVAELILPGIEQLQPAAEICQAYARAAAVSPLRLGKAAVDSNALQPASFHGNPYVYE